MKNTKKSFGWIAFIALLIAVVTSFSACQSGALFLMDRMLPGTESSTSAETGGTTSQSDLTTKSQDSTESTTQQPTTSDLNAETLTEEAALIAAIVKAESNPSAEGSAGTDPLSIPAVVNIVQETVVQIYTASGAGSGVIISAEQGWVVTCNHVIDGESAYTVELFNGTYYNATLVGADADSDLAILKITPDDGTILKAATLGVSDDLVVGESIVVVGNPLGTLGGTVSQGIISAKERQISFSNDDNTTTVMTLIQTDAAINSGNSGGAMFNRKGQLIGVVNAKYASSGVEGLGFAIPIDHAYEIMKELVVYGYVRNIPDDGLTLRDYTTTSRGAYGTSYNTVLYVSDSKYNSTLNGTVIVSVNGIEVNSASEYKGAIADCKVGDTLTIQYKTTSIRSNGFFGSQLVINNTVSETTLTLREKVPTWVASTAE